LGPLNALVTTLFVPTTTGGGAAEIQVGAARLVLLPVQSRAETSAGKCTMTKPRKQQETKEIVSCKKTLLA